MNFSKPLKQMSESATYSYGILEMCHAFMKDLLVLCELSMDGRSGRFKIEIILSSLGLFDAYLLCILTMAHTIRGYFPCHLVAE